MEHQNNIKIIVKETIKLEIIKSKVICAMNP